MVFPPSPFTWPTARDHGISQDEIERAVSDGRLVRVLRGVYADARLDQSPLFRAQASALVVSPFTVVRDRSAAWIWGVDCFDHAEHDGVPLVETCALRGHEPTDRGEVAGLVRDLAPDDWTVVAGVRVQTPLRTAMDLGCTLPPHRALGAMDALMRLHGFSVADVHRILRRYRRRRGVVQLRGLVGVLDPGAESQPESWLRWWVVEWGLPLPMTQVEVEVEGRVFRLDLAWPRARIALEYDGREFHSSPEQRAHDERRREALRREGWIVVVVDRTRLGVEQREEWLRELAVALRSRKVVA